jgi:hypothetical protein
MKVEILSTKVKYQHKNYALNEISIQNYALKELHIIEPAVETNSLRGLLGRRRVVILLQQNPRWGDFTVQQTVTS